MSMAIYYEVKGPRLYIASAILVTVFSFCLLVFSVANTTITIVPRFRNAALNERVNFTCVSNSTILLLSVTFLRNNIPDFFSPTTTIKNSVIFMLIAEENASVLCIGGSGIQPDASAFLYVQGIAVNTQLHEDI